MRQALFLHYRGSSSTRFSPGTCAFSFNHLVGASKQRDEVAPVGRTLLGGWLRRRLPRDEFPALRRFCPGVEEHEPQAARLAVDLRLDRRATGDECGVAHETHLAIAAGHALVPPLSRAQGRKPRRLGVGEARGIGIKKLVVKHRLERGEIAAAHRRIALVLKGEDFLVAAHRRNLPCGFTTRFELELAPFHVWMAPAWQEIIWRAAQRSLAVMCPACWCSPGGLLALMGSANRVLIIRTGSMSR